MNVFIGWQLNAVTGWGRYGMEFARELTRRRHRVTCLALDGVAHEPPLHQVALRGVGDWRAIQERTKALHVDVAFLALGNHGTGTELPPGVTADRVVACIFSEDTAWTSDEVAHLNTFELIVAGSWWNAEVLRAAGVTTRLEVVIQGVNPAIWHPAPRNPAFEGRFAVFSGGKLEFRKGQDIVVAAFREFRASHPEAVLVTAWQNVWPDTMQGIDLSGHVQGVPAQKGSQLDIAGWLERNGVPRSASIDVGLVPNHLLADIVRACDVAVFPNRAEGGTNLVAMECIAAGVPTIAAVNTGHIDIGPPALPLAIQCAVPTGCTLYSGTEGWGESDVSEVVAALEIERASTDRRFELVSAEAYGRRHSWVKTVDRLLGVVA